MDRPILHDPHYAMSDDLRRHVAAQDVYIAYLEGRLEGAAKPEPESKPGPSFSSLMEEFFGKGGYTPLDFSHTKK